MRKLLMVMVLFAMASSAMAGQPFVKVFDRNVKKICGACHMVFNPEMLPAKSWENIMAGLKDHFGVEVKLDETARGKVQYYLTNRSSDMSGSQNGRAFMEGINREEPPMRIIDTPRFKAKHKGVGDDVWARDSVKAKNNCTACHPNALKGDYEAKTMKIPG